MKKFSIKLDYNALQDIRVITFWYDAQKTGLGDRFQKTVMRQIEALAENPQIFAIRYKEIRCMLINKFPYMVHFYLNFETSTIEILAIIDTDRNPKVWEEKTGRI